MRKGKMYTLISFLLSFCVVIGGWFLTKKLLSQREEEFLNSTGQIVLKQSESLLWAESGKNMTEERTGNENVSDRETISETMMERILTVWESGGYQLLCEPGEDQMNMEQAIMEGKDWIANLTEKGVLPAYLEEGSFDKTDAAFYTLDEEVPFAKTLLNFWEITYTEGDVKITLKIHEVSGQVWKADILMDADKMIYDACPDEELLETAFPFLKTNETETIQDHQTIHKRFPEGKVFAALKRSEIKIDKEQETARLMLWLCAGDE